MKCETALLVLLLIIGSSRGDDTSPPTLSPNVRTALEHNASIFSNVLITGERTRRLLRPSNTVLNTLQTLESEATFTQRRRFELRFQGSRFRESIEYASGTSRAIDALLEVSFDGTKFIYGDKRLETPMESSIYIYNPTLASEFGNARDRPEYLAAMEFWYLCEAGFAGPQTLALLGQPVQSMLLLAEDQGTVVSVKEVSDGGGSVLEVLVEQPEPWQSRSTFDIETHGEFVSMTGGARELQMRMERERRRLVGRNRVIRFWLNPEFGYALQEKWELRGDTGETMFHTTNSEYVQVGPDGIWLPKRCVVESHAYYTAPLLTSADALYEDVLEVDTCEPGRFDDDTFRIWYDTPGAFVYDYTAPDATLDRPQEFRVPASIEQLQKETSDRGRVFWIVLVNLAIVVAWLAWWLFRSRRTRDEG